MNIGLLIWLAILTLLLLYNLQSTKNQEKQMDKVIEALESITGEDF